jgi:uncharacterized protein YdeI (YjbR/CyaY-like superfamily)
MAARAVSSGVEHRLYTPGCHWFDSSTAHLPPVKNPEPIFFKDGAEFRAWLEKNHDSAEEVRVGMYKKATGLPTITWEEIVDEALCFGWIDGRVNRIDDRSHMIRVTPRRPRSIWSNRNVERVAVLEAEGRMTDAGREAFGKRTEERTGVYSSERVAEAKLEPDQEKRFRANSKAWEFFQSQPPGYRRTAVHLVTSAKRPETRERRLGRLIEDSEAGLRIKELRPR